MPIDSRALREPAPRVSRLVARELLARVMDCRVRLRDGKDADALHDFRVAIRRLRSWIRAYRPWVCDTVRRKLERRLRRIAGATGESRDLEVQLQRVDALAKRADARSRPGVRELRAALSTRKRRADEKLDRVLAADFDRTTARLERRLGRYEVELDRPLTTFGEAASRLIIAQAAQVDEALGRVRSRADADEAHQARIAAKRLRYVLEPMADAYAAAARIVEDLKALQDALGDMHDARIFAEDVAKRMGRTSSHQAAPGLARVRERLRRDERTAYARAASRWVAGAKRERFSRRCARLTSQFA